MLGLDALTHGGFSHFALSSLDGLGLEVGKELNKGLANFVFGSNSDRHFLPELLHKLMDLGLDKPVVDQISFVVAKDRVQVLRLRLLLVKVTSRFPSLSFAYSSLEEMVATTISLNIKFSSSSAGFDSSLDSSDLSAFNRRSMLFRAGFLKLSAKTFPYA